MKRTNTEGPGNAFSVPIRMDKLSANNVSTIQSSSDSLSPKAVDDPGRSELPGLGDARPGHADDLAKGRSSEASLSKPASEIDLGRSVPEVPDTSLLVEDLDDDTDKFVAIVPDSASIDRYNAPQNWSSIIRYTVRDPFINRAKIIPYAALRSTRNRNNFRRLWVEGRAVELSPRDVSFQQSAENYLNGKAFFMKTLWPLTLMAMMIYDGIQLARFPGLSFDNTSLDIFAGFSPNSLSIATNMGSDIAAEFNYWCGFAILVAGPVLFGLGNIALHTRWGLNGPIDVIDPRDVGATQTIPDEEDILAEYIPAANRIEKRWLLDDYQALLEDNPAPKHPSWLNPLSERRQLLDFAVFSLLYRADMDEMIIRSDHCRWYQHHAGLMSGNFDQTTLTTKGRFLLGCIERLSSMPPSLAQQYAFEALATIVDKLSGSVGKPREEPLFPSSHDTDRSLSGGTGESLVLVPRPSSADKAGLRQRAFSALLKGGYRGKYQLWTTGFKDFGMVLTLLFGGYASIKSLWLLYTYYRYFLFLVRKIIGGVEFLVAKGDCENSGKLYRYDPDIGNYDCSICGDWPTVFDTHTSQGCLSGLLESSGNPDEINSGLVRIKRFATNFSDISLVGQNWIIWSEQQFKYFIRNLTSMTAIGTFNVSRAEYNIVFPQITNKTVELAELNQRSCVTKWDFSNQRMGDAIKPFLDSLRSNPCVQEFAVKGNALADQNMRKLADVFNTTRIETLDLDHNNLSGEVLDYFAEHGQQGLLRDISVCTNFLGQTGLNAVGKLIARNPNLMQLLLGNNNFSGLDFSQFGAELQRSHVQSLSLNGCSLGSDEIAELAPYLNSTQSVNLADNNGLNREAAQVLMASFQGSDTIELSLRGMPMDNRTLQELGNGLLGTNIESIDISDSEIKGEDFISFLQKFKGTKVQRLKASDNLFGPNTCRQIAEVITQQGLIFTEFDLSTNNMSDQVGASLVSALTANSTNISIRLNNNSLGPLTANVLKEKIAAGRIVGLEVNRNQFSSADLDAIAMALPNSLLESFSYRNNGKALDGTVETNIALQLLKDIPDKVDIVNDPPSRDLARWIHSKGQPQTSIVSINSQENNVALPGARALCNVMKSAKLKPHNVLISTQGINPNANPCFFNRNNQNHSQLQLPVFRGTSSSQPQSGGMMMLALGIPVIGFVLFAVLLYKWFNSTQTEKTEKRKNYRL